MIDHDEVRVGGDAPRGARLAVMQAERWGVTFSTWPARGVLNGAPVDLRALERAAAVVRPGVGEGVRDWQELASSTGEGGAPGLVWDVRGLYFGSADPHGVGGSTLCACHASGRRSPCWRMTQRGSTICCAGRCRG